MELLINWLCKRNSAFKIPIIGSENSSPVVQTQAAVTQEKKISLVQKTKGNLHISEDDIGSACGFQAIMRYYDPHWACISWNTVLSISPYPGVVHWKSPVQLRMSEFWRKNYSKICLKQWGLMWVNTTFSKAFKNPSVKNMVFILFLINFFFLFSQAFASPPSWRKSERSFKGYP